MQARLANAPLIEVVFELRFPGNFAVYAGLDRFQQTLGEDFPSLLVPKVQAGEALALKPFQWQSEDGSRSINVALNLFSFMSRKYGVFGEFRSEFRKYADSFFGIYSPKKFTRLGLRFINLFPQLDSTVSALHPWLDLGMRTPVSPEGTVREIQGSMVVDVPPSQLRMTFGKAIQNSPRPGTPFAGLTEGFVLDFDFYREGSIPMDEMLPFLETGHEIIESWFFSLLRSDALKMLEGKS
jgi:uncharacterized protein (TIGR04255 family)